MDNLHPSTWFPVVPGTDREVLDREVIRTWMKLLAGRSEHMHVTTFGASTEGKPLDAVFIGDAVSGSRLQALTDVRSRYVDALLSRPEEAKAYDWSIPVVLITAGIHATELGPPQAIPELLHWLVVSDDDDARLIRERVITIIVPTLNPDGMDLVKRWHEKGLDTEHEGSNPPLLYHRFAGHDNNRDWFFRNLAETRALLDGIHATWLPHVTLDQHQMSKFGPRFYLPPYANPWDPHVHPSIIAAGSSLGQSIAADLTLRGLPGVTTGRYFDAWEPSRALQHYRGGVRILAEAASANVACPVDVEQSLLEKAPFTMDRHQTSATPLPWSRGSWRLRDIMDYHLESAKSLLRHVSASTRKWITVQEQSLAKPISDPITIRIPFNQSYGDTDANRRLANLLAEAGASPCEPRDATGVAFNFNQPQGALLRSTLLPTPYPEVYGKQSYDVTTHHFPFFIGASIEAVANGPSKREKTPSVHYNSGGIAVIDARNHLAPNIIEAALQAGQGVWRTTKRGLHEKTLIESGSWLVEDSAEFLNRGSSQSENGFIGSLPSDCCTVSRNSTVLVSLTDIPASDHGWTRWWLHARDIPFLEQQLRHLKIDEKAARDTTFLIAHTDRDHINDTSLRLAIELVRKGSTVIAFGAAGRALGPMASPSIAAIHSEDIATMHAPGALLRLVVNRNSPLGRGLNRSLPAMFQNDGAFEVDGEEPAVSALAHFAARGTVISGWMAGGERIRNHKAILQIQLGKGILYAFSFKPLFRGQMLVTSPLVHNVLYQQAES